MNQTRQVNKLRNVELVVNGQPVRDAVVPRTSLADFLREGHQLTGTHVGCEHGVCGACTVMIDGVPSRSCITFALSCDGSTIRTIEGFVDDPLMTSLRSAFRDHHALQCGFCTPGMLITSYDIVRRLPDADEARVRQELGGNLCRCTGYMGIVDAILEVLESPPTLEERSSPSPITTDSHTHYPSSSHRNAPIRTDAPNVVFPDPVDSLGTRLDGHNNTSGFATSIEVNAGIDELWRVVSRPSEVVVCLPGAKLIEVRDDNSFDFEFGVGIGPMRIAMIGQGTVSYEPNQHTGRMAGQGRDRATRSSGEGEVGFALHALTTDRTRMNVSIDYRLKGPLAQFSRGAIVDAVVSKLLERFARNLSAKFGDGGSESRDEVEIENETGVVARLKRWLKT